MPLQTTTIGAYPKPDCTPVRDWFLAHMSEEERKASSGLLSNWGPGEYEKALEYQQKALVIRKEVLDPKHPDLAYSYDNIGAIYQDMGDS